MSSLGRLIPRALRAGMRRVAHYGRACHCPVCGSAVRAFVAGGVVPRPRARCPVCGALERHRLVWFFLVERTNLCDGRSKRMLHIAPEPQLAPKLRAIAGLDYLSADLEDPSAMIRMDVTAIQFPDDSFDVIYCSHVLEHVPDDRQAMRELRRVLRPDGWAVLQVPITAAVTDEDPSITDPRERLRRFGQDDHVRRYGPDYVDRLREAGFEVACKAPEEIVGGANLARLGVLENETLFYCVKR